LGLESNGTLRYSRAPEWVASYYLAQSMAAAIKGPERILAGFCRVPKEEECLEITSKM
jgi:hypothetical protein